MFRQSVSTAKNDDANIEIKADINIPKKSYISPEERQQIIDELRLVPKRMYISRNYWWIKLTSKERYISLKER